MSTNVPAAGGFARPGNAMDSEPTHWWTASNVPACRKLSDPGGIGYAGPRDRELPHRPCHECLTALAQVASLGIEL